MKKMQEDELKRLEWLDKNANHSHGLKNVHRAKNDRSRSRTRSTAKGRTFVNEGDYQEWTNVYARKTVLWDEERDLLEGEKKFYEKPHKIRRNPANCCGNSPGKGHGYHKNVLEGPGKGRKSGK